MSVDVFSLPVLEELTAHISRRQVGDESPVIVVDHPRVRDAISEIVNRAGERGIAVGIWVPDAKAARFWVENGVLFVTVSNNELLLFSASAKLRRSLARRPRR